MQLTYLRFADSSTLDVLREELDLLPCQLLPEPLLRQQVDDVVHDAGSASRRFHATYTASVPVSRQPGQAAPFSGSARECSEC